MIVDILTKEYPPEIYGGAGVHVAELVKVLQHDIEVRVRCFGAERAMPEATAYPVPSTLVNANGALQTLGIDVAMAAAVAGADIVHSHTWYANLGGHLAALLHGIPHVISAHSLEPLRPWKAEQLGGGYAVSSWAEKTAYEGAAAIIAVSAGMRDDILRAYPAVDPTRVKVVHNGIDLETWQFNTQTETLERYGIDPQRPYVVFVGRITRQKGLPYFLRSCRELAPEVQVVLCAGAPDTPDIAAEVAGLVADLQSTREGVFLISEMLPRAELTQVLSHATVFACPSIYEPLGIVNLEAMACGVPVVATRTGGIPEVVVSGETGWLVDIEQVSDGTGTPLNPEVFVADLATTLNEALSDVVRAKAFGKASRERVEQHFAWSSIGEKTQAVYQDVLAQA